MEDYVGTIRLFAGSYAPTNWALCQGQSLSVAQYPNLFAVIGYAYGGSGASFNLPDLRNAAPVGAGTSATSGVNYTVGMKGGSSTVTLTQNNLPAHAHMLIGGMEAPANADYAGIPDPENAYLGAPSFPLYTDGSNANSFMAPVNTDLTLQSTPPQQNAPVQNMMPSLAVNYIIAMDGNIVAE